MTKSTSNRHALKIKYQPGYRYVDIDLTQSDEAVRQQVNELGKLLGWHDDTNDRQGGKRMKLKARAVPYSSGVGGGMTLIDENGCVRFIVMFGGTTEGITKSETEALSEQFSAFVNAYGLSVPSRSDP